uniref:ATP-binding protein n=1 Tax=Thermosporothrix sp. COM3 TaxID=2490863 RepID=A0A455SX64_9CHLR|nr:ATP-binding protein [Thermosporothrix sp. COM3]
MERRDHGLESLGALVARSTWRTRPPQVTMLSPGQGPQQASEERCAQCRGTGFVRREVPFGHPQFGKALPCVCTRKAQHAREAALLRELSRLDTLPRYRQATFEHFEASLPGVAEAYTAALAYAEQPAGWLVLLGSYGCGKTHLAVAIAHERLAAGERVVFLTVPDLLDHLRSAFAPNAPATYDELFARVREVELLVLDDLGAEHRTPWANEKLFQLLNHRYNAMLPTVITSNRMALEGIDHRIVSRLHDRELVRQILMDEAQDYRVCLSGRQALGEREHS